MVVFGEGVQPTATAVGETVIRGRPSYFACCADGLGLQSRMPLSRSAAVARNCESVDQLKLITGFPNINYSSSQTWIHVATQVKDYVKTRLLTLPGKNLVVAQK